MGRREDINKELDQLAIEIEKDAMLARYEHAAKNRPALATDLLLDIVIPQNAQTRLQIRISTQPVDDGETS
ncbi:hypothetical protein [Paraburkholderia heleia]|uniref:hypothetical protein n=1 Tax=Paraburkholderia heleia TaxID=634127 RepID=UPI0031D2F728